MVDQREAMTAKKSELVHIPIQNEKIESGDILPGEMALNDKLKKFVLRSDILRESISEFIATFLLVFLGDCVIATLIFSRAGSVSLASAPMGWGLALLVAVAVTGGASGCHANPAVTLAFATIKKLRWNRVLPYFLAQYLGAFFAAALVYAVYYDSIVDYDGGVRQVPPDEKSTAQIFATYPSAHVSLWAAFLDQIIATAILLLALVAMIDPRNLAIPKGLYPLIIGLVLGAILYALPYNCMAPLNPARDLSPRLFTLIVGYGVKVFSHMEHRYFVVPLAAPHIGAILGVWIYKLAIEIHWPKDETLFLKEARAGYGNVEKLAVNEDCELLDQDSGPLYEDPCAPPTTPLIHIDR